MNFEAKSQVDTKLTPEYSGHAPNIAKELVEIRNEEMEEATETERNIAAALAIKFESTLLQIQKRTRTEEGKVNRELNEAISTLISKLENYTHMGGSDEKAFSPDKIQSLISFFESATNKLDVEMGIQK